MDRQGPGKRRTLVVFVFFFALFSSKPARAQDADPPNALPASSQQSSSPASSTSITERDVSWRRLAPNVLHDQKEVWLFPVNSVHEQKHFLPILAVTGITGGLIAGDPYDVSYFRRTSTFSGFNRVFSGTNTTAASLVAPLAFYGVGLIRKDREEQKTALFAGEALIDTFIVSSGIKVSTLRLRPSDVPPNGNFTDTFFEQHSITAGSFPSGHTIAAFSVATIFARRYPQHHWVAWLAYGAATAVGFSRLTLQSHFPSDVFLGAALGYSISRFAVLGQ